MIKKLMPVVFLLIGTGAGVGAGVFLRPATPEVHHGDDAEAAPPSALEASGATAHAKNDSGGAQEEKEYVKLNNQFVIPVVKDAKVVGLVAMTLSLEVPYGQKENIFAHEPRIRDSFLQVLFDHANIGGFEGSFTSANNLSVLRNALREVAQKDMGKDIVSDVLILEIARQDY